MRKMKSLTPEMKQRASKTAFLICVSDAAEGAASGHNKFYNLYLIDGDTWVEYGRVDSTTTIEMESGEVMFERKLLEKTNPKRGKNQYRDVTHLKAGIKTVTLKGKSGQFASISEPSVARVMDALMSASRKIVQTNYKVAVEAVSQLMIDEAQAVLNELASLAGRQAAVGEMNKRLLALYAILPRKMNKVEDYLIKQHGDVQRFLASEQNILDSMAGQVVTNLAQNQGAGTILEALGITVEPTTPAQHKAILDRMSEALTRVSWTNEIYGVTATWVVTNAKTQAALKTHVAERPNKNTMLLWHGSRTENWLSILEAGLLIKPAGATTSGSRFGDGVYHSDTARKSIGYTSIEGSYWSNGSASRAYMGMYEVHTGQEKIVTSGDGGLNARRIAPADSVFVPKDPPYQYNTERITYNTAQSTIRFLLEIQRVR